MSGTAVTPTPTPTAPQAPAAAHGPSSYARRRLNVTIQIGQGKNGEDGFDTYALPSYLRIRAGITKSGGLTQGHMQLSVFGLSLDLMNKVSSLGLSVVRRRLNKVSLSAGDDLGGMVTVFDGMIEEAWHDFSGSPDTALTLRAFAELQQALKPVPPTSYAKPSDAATVMQDLAGKAGLNFENGGVQVQLPPMYFHGTLREQMLACAEAGGFNWIVDLATLAIWPKDGHRGGLVPLIAPETGMIGYPVLGGNNDVRCLTRFNGQIAVGSLVKVQSVIKPACGEWKVNLLNHDLESETPGGLWQTTFEAGPPGIVRVVR